MNSGGFFSIKDVVNRINAKFLILNEKKKAYIDQYIKESKNYYANYMYDKKYNNLYYKILSLFKYKIPTIEEFKEKLVLDPFNIDYGNMSAIERLRYTYLCPSLPADYVRLETAIEKLEIIVNNIKHIESDTIFLSFEDMDIIF